MTATTAALIALAIITAALLVALVTGSLDGAIGEVRP